MSLQRKDEEILTTLLPHYLSPSIASQSYLYIYVCNICDVPHIYRQYLNTLIWLKIPILVWLVRFC